ncbi:uncharacterized protein LOC141816556, partial [Curcuma longa]|uniref:uncharacterized protein LOC141816556 n=1 Tax=Curcuma longa TaxID=136217 RepID=UPI003D9E0E8F
MTILFVLNWRRNIFPSQIDHLGRFENATLLHQYTDVIKCQVFLTTLAGSALRWFNRLPSTSICSFGDFKSAFLRHFATSKTYRNTSLDLFSVKQKSRESLKEYVHRFNQVAQEITAAASDVLVSSFSQGLIEGDFFMSLIKKPSENFDMLLTRAVKYIHVEEAQSARRRDSDLQHHGGPSRQSALISRKEQRSRKAAPAPKPRREIDNQAAQPSLPYSPRAAYKRHRSPRELTPPTRNEGDRSQGIGPRDPRAGNQDNAPCGNIHMITGGATDGDSNRARKAHSRQLEVCDVGGGNRGDDPTIGFGPQDLEGVETPHDDALVKMATIANYYISRVFVDTDISVNIIFKKAFDQMQIDEADLEPMATSLYGFTRNEVRPLGQIRLAISLSEEPTRRTRYPFFTIVDAPSSYN